MSTNLREKKCLENEAVYLLLKGGIIYEEEYHLSKTPLLRLSSIFVSVPRISKHRISFWCLETYVRETPEKKILGLNFTVCIKNS